jgi:glycogen synthase
VRILRASSVFGSVDPNLELIGPRFDPIGGLQNHTLNLTSHLDELGLQQTVVTARCGRLPKWQRLGTRSQVFRVGLPVPRFRQMYAFPAARCLRRIAARSDIVHAHLGEDIAILPIAYEAARSRDLPFVVTVHCSLRHTLRVVDPRTALLKLIGGAVEERFLSRADAVITLTHRTASALRGMDGDRIFVIPPGGIPTDAEAYTWARTADRTVDVYRSVLGEPVGSERPVPARLRKVV